jgi:hypothetical protein
MRCGIKPIRWRKIYMPVMRHERAFEKHEIAFKVDDLLINILPTQEVEEWVWCLDHFFCIKVCTLHGCLEHNPPNEISIAFAKLKQDLKEQLKRRTMEQIREEMRPQSVAEVDELQQKLHAALVELDSRRVELERRKDQ